MRRKLPLPAGLDPDPHPVGEKKLRPYLNKFQKPSTLPAGKPKFQFKESSLLGYGYDTRIVGWLRSSSKKDEQLNLWTKPASWP